MQYVLIDYETSSFANLPAVGSYVYSQHPSTKILMAAVSLEGGRAAVRPKLGKLTDDERPVSWGRFDYDVYRAIEDPSYPSRKWLDLSALSLYLGMPAGLEKAAKAFGIPVKKDVRGKRLIQKYSLNPTLEIPPEDWKAFEEYAQRDTEILQRLFAILRPIIPEWERRCREAYEMTQRMNERGVPIDREAALMAVLQCRDHEEQLTEEMMSLAGLKPTQALALAKFLGTEDVTKQTLQSTRFEGKVLGRVSEIRLDFAQAATKKLQPMIDMSAFTGRAHGCFVFNGAHTGRGSSRGIQLQNLKRNKTESEVFEKLMTGVQLDHPLRDIGRNIRGFIKPHEGRALCVADYAQIEARLVAWMADEATMLTAFREKKDIYREFASRAYKVPLEEVTDEQRTFGKIAVLGAGYGAGGTKIAEQGVTYGIDMSIKAGDVLKRKYATLYPNIPKMWADLDEAVRGVVTGRMKTAHVAKCKFQMIHDGHVLGLRLPSGRTLRYFYPHVDDSGTIFYESKYGTKKIWGGHFTENIAQAIATDLKNEAMVTLDGKGALVIAEVHDEIIVEERREDAKKRLDQMINIMQDPELKDLDGLILAEGKVMARYSK